MIILVATLCLIFFSVWIAVRFFWWLILFAIRRWAKVDIKFGQIGFLKLKNVSIYLQPALLVEIKQISLSSCYANSKHRKPIVFCVSELQLNADFSSLQSFFASRPKRKSASQQKKSHFLKFLPLTKLIGLDVSNTSLVLNVDSICSAVIQLHVDKLSPNFAAVSSNRLLGSVQLESLKLQLLETSAEVGSDPHSQLCLASLSMNQTLEIQINPRNLQDIEIINVSLSHCSVITTKEFLRHMNTYSVFKTVKGEPKTEATVTERGSQGLTLVPKNIKFDIGDLEIALEKESSQRDLSMTVTLLQLRINQTCNGDDLNTTEIKGSVLVKGASMKSNGSTLLAVNQLNTTVLADNIKTDIDVQLAGGFLGYDQMILNYWITFFDQCSTHSDDVYRTSHLKENELDHGVEDHDHSECHDPSLDRVRRNYDHINDSVYHTTGSGLHQQQAAEARPKSSASKYSRLFGGFASKMIRLSVDVVEVSTTVTVDASGLEAGLQRWKMSGTFKPKVSADSSPAFEDVQYELDVMSAYCRIADKSLPSYDLSAKQHLWNTLFYAGVVIVKCIRFSQQLNQDILVDSLRLEASSVLLDTIDKIIGALLRQLTFIRNMRRKKADDKQISQSQVEVSKDQSVQANDLGSSEKTVPTIVTRHLQLTNFNLFLCCANKAAAMVRCDTVILQQRAEKSTLSLSEVKVTHFMQQLKHQPIVRAADLQDFVMYVMSTDVELSNTAKTLNVKVPNGVFVLWTMSVHMCFHQIFSHITDLTQNHSASFKRTSGSSDESERRSRAPDESEMKKSRVPVLSMDVSFGGRIKLEMHLPNQHSIMLTAIEATFNKSNIQKNFYCPRLDIYFDGHSMFLLEGMHISSQDNDNTFRMERSAARTLELVTNRAWTIAFDNFQVIFPNEYNFAECLQELKNVNKWRKIIYKKKSMTKSSADSVLPPDLLITSKSVLVQLSDSPFEVKLRQIYETLSHVGVERERWEAAMDSRIEEIQRTQGMISANKIQELYSLLSQKASEYYIRKMMLLNNDASTRTGLFRWTMKDLKIFALADTSYNNKEKIMKHIKEIDPESPLPNDGCLEFVSLFCRTISASTSSLTLQLRDFPHSLLDIRDWHVWGRLIGAEPLGAPKARRTAVIEMGGPWESLTVERNMPQMKFFHDFSSDVETFDMAYGPCWEPTMAQVNLALNKISRPSVDPSPPLPFWDKFRLLLHGRLTISVQQTRWLYHASLDPYNETEFMDWTWTGFLLDWTNAKWILNGNLDVFSKTASKYNDCRLLHLPNLRLSIRLEWLCSGDSNDHHSVMPCAPEKILEYDVQGYDSYRSFRSNGFNIGFSFEIGNKDGVAGEEDVPSCLFFASTLRWIDKIKMCLNRISRPVKRGPLFRTAGHRKKALSRHMQNVKLTVDFPKLQFYYWVSFAKQNGAMLESDRFTMAVNLKSNQKAITDGLKHRPTVEWSIQQLNCHLSNSVVWLCCTNPIIEKRKSSFQDKHHHSAGGTNPKSFLLRVDEVSYERQEKTEISGEPLSSENGQESEEPVQKVKVFNLKAMWTTSNRNVAFTLFDSYSKAQMLKSNLLSEALKGFKVETNQTPKKNRRATQTDFSGDGKTFVNIALSPQLRSQMGPAHILLQQLIKEAGSVAVHEELSGKVVDFESLQGFGACYTDDIICTNWDVELFNSQVMLKGCETSGYVIASAAKTSLLSRSHRPFWSDGQLKTKTTLIGTVECMQYYATVDSGSEGSSQNVQWLTKENIEDKPLEGFGTDDLSLLAGMASSGRSVGGVVSDTVGSATEDCRIQLQRIISRCCCQFFCAWYGEVKDEPLQEIPIPLGDAESDMMKRQEGVDAFTLFHHDLNICTNSLQYATILDIVNNLLLYVDPKKKELTEKLQDMRFKRHLSSVEDQRTPISQRQDTLRKLVSASRTLEREHYMKQRKFDEDRSNESLFGEIQELQKHLEDTKENVNTLSEELAIMVSCYKESRLQVLSQGLSSKTDKTEITVRQIDLFFKHAEWRMTEADGQIGIADLVLTNFLYTNRRTANVSKEKSDSGSRHLTDSGSHHLELGWFKVTNLLPNSIYSDVFVPQDPTDGIFTDRQVAFRVRCEFSSPVGGISVKKHFEVNVAPLTIQLTTRFYTSVMAFFFPGKPVDSDDECDSDTASTGSNSAMLMKTKEEKKEKKKSLTRGSKMLQSSYNDIDKMKERAAKNNLFVYIKIPEVPLRVSYKSENEKLIPNIHDFRLILPLLEYHNQTWMWHDLAMAIKSDCKKVIVKQVLKHKLHIKSRSIIPDVFLPEMEEHEELDLASRDARKAQALLGATIMDTEEKPSKRKNLIGKPNK